MPHTTPLQRPPRQLAAVHLLKASVISAAFIAVFSVATYLRGVTFHKFYAPRATEVSLQQSMELDAEVWANDDLVDDVSTDTQIPASLLSVLYSGTRVYERGALPHEHQELMARTSKKMVASRDARTPPSEDPSSTEHFASSVSTERVAMTAAV